MYEKSPRLLASHRTHEMRDYETEQRASYYSELKNFQVRITVLYSYLSINHNNIILTSESQDFFKNPKHHISFHLHDGNTYRKFRILTYKVESHASHYSFNSEPFTEVNSPKILGAHLSGLLRSERFKNLMTEFSILLEHSK